MPPSAAPPDEPLAPTVKALGVVSLCTDLSSEMVYPLTPILLTKVLGAPPWVIGVVEGFAESTASILKLYSGYLSDKMGRRKPLTLAGYALAAFSKPLLGMAGGWGQVLSARLMDRTGKGLRAAPRDALIADNTPPAQRGRAFGFHRSMDTTGAVLGPLVAFLFLRYYPEQLRLVYLLAFIPAAIGVLVLWLFVREVKKERNSDNSVALPTFALSGLSPELKRYLLVVGLFGLGNSSDAFLLLKAQSMGVSSANLLLLYALFNMVEAALAYTAGRWGDRAGRRPLIAAGWGVFALVYLGFALFNSPWAATVLFLLYGLYHTLTQGTQKALAADLAHPARRGAEIGAYHLLVGIAALPASLVAGWLYTNVSPSAPFYLGAATATLALVALLVTSPRHDASNTMP